MASQPDVLQHCLQEAASASRPALTHCIEQAVAALQALESQSMKALERDELASAWRHLQDHKVAWSARYSADLMSAFARSVAATSAVKPFSPPNMSVARNTGRAGRDTFSLVDDTHVAQAIESSRLLQHLLPRVEQQLAELDTLISSVQGLENVQPELNPLRPDVFTRTLQDLLATAAVEPTMLSTCIRHLAEPLGKELNGIYKKIIALLEQAHVQAANYRVLQTPASAMGRSSGRSSGGASGGASGSSSGNGSGNGSGSGVPAGDDDTGEPAKPPSQYADLSNYEIRDELFQDFLFHGGSNANHGLAPSYYASVEEELTALRQAPDSAASPLTASGAPGQSDYQNIAAVDRPQRFVDVSSALSAKVWGAYSRSRERAMVRTQLKKEATRVGQVLGLEVVRKLVNQVAQDPRLLVPVREAIVALEPSLLRLAMVDPRFFSDEGHPGRRLMERVAQRSFKYNDEYSAEFNGFFQPVTQAFNALNAQDIEDAKPFGTALAALENAWDEQDQQIFQSRRKVLQALHFAEYRQERADQIAFDLSARSDLEHVPGAVLDFLFGPWALAMAHAKLHDQRNQVDPEGFGSVVPDLLWSVKRDVTLKRPAKLIEMIPGLLEKLHAGLAMLGQDPKENEKFFETLMMLHQPVLKLRRLKSKRDAEESGAVPLEAEALPATPEQRRAKAAEQPWLGRDELDAAGFEDTQPTAAGDLVFLDEPTEQAAEMASSEPVPAELAPGTAQATQPMPISMSKPVVAANDANRPTDTSHGDITAASGVTEPGPLSTALPAYSKDEAEAMLLATRTGSWVDLYSKRRWLRAQLIWASTKATLFMFLSHGGQPHSMTKRSCEKLIMQRLLRPVDTDGVIAQALDTLAAEAAASAAASANAAVAQDEAETA